MASEIVVKIGGSLFDLPDLGQRLRSWLATLPTRRVLLVAGGGAAADMVQHADDLGEIGEERGHWLALRALTFTAHLLAGRLAGGVVIEDIADRERAWQRSHTPLLDLHAFALADEARPDHLPHLWSATSDSLAARVAVVAGMPELILLKSCDPPETGDWTAAARRGVVDAVFPQVMQAAGPQLRASIVNFRAQLRARAEIVEGC
jgi:aspartokinase-like uncharacterized kinase